LVVVLGSRLGIQQTGFNWTNWTKAQVVQVDIDQSELEKGHPRVDFPINTDANAVLAALTKKDFKRRDEWMEFCHSVRREVPIVDEANENHKEFMSPFELMTLLTEESRTKDVFIPASSGSGQFVPMETLQLRRGQRMFTNKGLASMGYGLAAAVGAALADRTRRVFLIEGDGSFSQNFQELGTVVAQSLNLKVLLLDNDGYASIRTTQRNYFGGVYLGCDAETGLGFPNWIKLAESFGIPVLTIAGEGIQEEHRSLLEQDGPAMFVVKVDPEQTYFPKVSSSLGQNGEMVSNPIHSMTPPLSAETMARISALRNW
jgi:acetolactate synthase-1/2/3 large subunit